MQQDKERRNLPAFIEQRNKRINAKSKRRKNLIKKAIEFRRMCGLEVLIIVRDNEFNKVQVYNSSEDCFSPDTINLIISPNNN